MARVTKQERVLNYLMNNGNITSMEAISKFGATRLAAIIFELRKKGYDIETKMEDMTDRYGNENSYARYIYHRKAC